MVNLIKNNIKFLGVVKKEISKPIQDSNCTGHILLISTNRILIDPNNVTQKGFYTADPLSKSEPAFISNSSKKFYYLGNPFNKTLMFGLGTKMVTDSKSQIDLGAITETKDAVTTPRSGQIESSTSHFIITGIKRPTIENLFLDAQYKSIFNEVAYFCNSAQIGTQQIWGNFITPISTIKKNAFIIDYNPSVYTSLSSKKFAVEFSYDNKNSEIIKSDSAGNMRAVITLPVKTNGGFSLKFSMDNNALTDDSICGIVSSDLNAVTNCQKNTQFYSCPLPKTDIKYSICCYNVSINFNNISILSLEVYAEQEPKEFNTPFSNSLIYSTNDKTLTWKNTQSTGFDVVSNKNAILTDLEYFHVMQDGGIGKMKLTFLLPREITRNSIYSLKGDFGDIFIPNVFTKCIVEVKEEPGVTGNSIIDYCDAPGGNADKDPIIITTKNIIYKCGLTFSKILYVTLSPVKVIDWTNPINSSKTFRFTMTLNNKTLTEIANNKLTFNIPTTKLKFAKNRPNLESQWDNLCKVTKINTPIPGEIADYQFDFDLDTSKEKLTGTIPNELTIFFPYINYSISDSYVYCYYNKIYQRCSFSDEETLNIRFDKLPFGSGKRISVIVTGIPNPDFSSPISFVCTVNNINQETGERTNIITGSGKLENIVKVQESANWGVIRLLNKLTVSDNNPRSISTHNFKITFDTALGLSTLPIVFQHSPMLIITFPKEYNLGLYINNDETQNPISVSIDEYINDKSNNVIKSNVIFSAKLEIRGNKIIFYFYNKNYTFQNNFQYWQINIDGIVNPSETTSPSGSETTSQFHFLLTDENYSYIFKSYSNLNTAATNPMFSPIDNFINMNRGIEFKYDNSKWVIDVNSMGNLNKITAKPGRFVLSTFQIKPNSSLTIKPRSINISLKDNIFKLSDITYLISTGVFHPVKFYIGCPCSTTSGKYILNFVMEGDPSFNFFSKLVPVEILINVKIESSIIEFLKPEIVPPGGSTPIYFNIMEPNFDDLNLTFIPNPLSLTDSSAKINKLIIPRAIIKSGFDYIILSNFFTQFSISNLAIKTSQQFLPQEINSCFSWSLKTRIIEISLSGEPAIIDSTAEFASGFQYFNSETDGLNSSLPKNAIKFTFLPKVSPIYIYCALVCHTSGFPSDDIIKSGKVSQNLESFVNALISSKITPTDLIFNNLVRGQRYKLKCIITSTQSEMKDRTSASQEILTLAGGKTFIPTNPTKTQCIHYQFLDLINNETKLILLNHCQNIFSQVNSGCIVCTDSLLSIFTPGLSMPNNLKCPVQASIVIKSSRFLQGNNKNSTNTNNDIQVENPVYLLEIKNPTIFTICPTQIPTCPIDVKGEKIYGDYFNSFYKQTNSEFIKSIQGMNNKTLNNSMIVFDNFAPNLSQKLNLNMLLIDKSGLVQWTASYPTPLKCFWKIDLSENRQTLKSIEECKDPMWCGNNYQIFQLENSGNTNPKNLRRFEEKKEYAINFLCYNNIPDPMYSSDIYTNPLGTPNIPIDINQQNKTQSDIKPSDNSTNSTNTTNTTTSTSFIQIDYLKNIIFIYMILFIII